MNYHVALVEIEFKNVTPLFITDCGFDVVADSKTYRALGDVLKISKVSSKSTVDTKGAKIELDGKTEFIRELNLNKYVGGLVTISIGEFNSSNTLVKKTLLSRGYMNKPSVVKNMKSTIIKLELNSVFYSFKEKNIVYALNWSHKLRPYGSDDDAFKYAGEY